jgi:hypothetical protein
LDLRRARLKLNVDNIAVEGLGHVDHEALREAIHQELSRLIAEQGVPPSLGAGERPSHSVTAQPGMSSRAVGAQVARAIYGGMGGAGQGG